MNNIKVYFCVSYDSNNKEHDPVGQCNGEGLSLYLLRCRNCVLYLREVETSRRYGEEKSTK
jgi:hypothetical protein